MKIKGKKIYSRNYEVVVLPRPNDENLVFRLQAVCDFTDFDKLYPVPKAPTVIRPGIGRVEDVKSPAYVAAIGARNAARMSYMILKSLEATEGLEWETVFWNDPSTWENYKKELMDAGLADVEISRIIKAAFVANSLDEERIEEARMSFLLMEASLRSSSFQEEEQASTPSGEPVSDLA